MNGPHLRFKELLEKHSEWLLVHSTGKGFALRSHEMEFSCPGGKPLFGFLDEDGYKTWRITAVTYQDKSTKLELAGRFGKEEIQVTLVPRASAAEFGAEVELSRLERANGLAAKVCAAFSRSELKRISLSRGAGRFARMIFETRGANGFGVIADMSGRLAPEALLSSALLWLSKLERRSKKPIYKLYILVERRRSGPLKRLHACLSGSRKEAIGLLSIAESHLRSDEKGMDPQVVPENGMELDQLWKGRAPALKAPPVKELSAAAKSIISIEPKKIDHLFSGNGITLRFLGLPFVRIRKVLGKEQIWFGIEKEKQILSDRNLKELFDLIRSMARIRTHDSLNKQHLYYHAAPEAWLESLLRRNIQILDANLVLSPLYNQFRTSRDTIDLLAIRSDGRLVIIELKVSPDKNMVFQAVGYWRKIELQHRRGLLARTGIFGSRRISNKPALIYLAAPTLSFHKEVAELAESVAPEIGICRFELSENWRQRLKMLRVDVRGYK